MAGRPPKEDSRDKQYRVRLNDAEDEMLSFCSEETGEAKSEIFRKALKAYYENTKYFKNILILNFISTQLVRKINFLIKLID